MARGVCRLAPDVVQALVNVMEARAPSLRVHSQRIADLAASIADALDLGTQTVEDVRLAGQLHDVGMIGVPEGILAKPGPLTDAERAQVRAHVRLGEGILAPLTALGPVLEYVRHHHERVDGRGYPAGLTGPEISIGGRILAAADAFDALTTNRPYREPMEQEEALVLLAGVVGAALDAAVYRALAHVVSTRRLLPFVEDDAGQPGRSCRGLSSVA